MPPAKKDAVHRYFEYDITSNTSICELCKNKLKGKHTSNLKNHLATKHTNEYIVVDDLNKKKAGSKKSTRQGEAFESPRLKLSAKLKTDQNEDPLWIPSAPFKRPQEIISQVPFNIRGILAPVFTPIDERGRINPEVVPEYAEYLKKTGVPGVLVGGTTGEAVSLSLEERKLMLCAWVKAAKPLGLKIIAQVGGVPFPDVLAMAAYGQEIGADCIMTLPELYFKPKTCERLVSYLELVSKAAPSLPLLYYHFPMMTGVDVNVSEFFALASSRIPNFKGMKADLGVAVQVAPQLVDDQRIFIANHLLAPSALLGHVSSIATVTNMFPGLAQDLVNATRAGDTIRARSLQEEMNNLVAGITAQGDFVPSMKAAMELTTGIKVGPPRLPQVPLDSTRWTRVADHLRHSGIQILNSE